MPDWNAAIIDEFRANHGKIGGQFEGAPLLLLHTTGAKTGAERVNPVMYRPVDGGWAVFASKGGAPTNPDWFHNLVANPKVKVEVGDDTFDAVARVLEGDERERVWQPHMEAWPGFADYENKTSRQIPVVLLEPLETT